MDDTPARFWFDYVDPVSFLMEFRLRRAEARVGATVERRGWEIAPPPAEPLDPRDPAWSGRWEEVATHAREEGVELARPLRVPWTRKAHELALHAAGDEDGAPDGGAGGPAEAGPGALSGFTEVHDALFRAYHLEGRDIGRIDVLVAIAEGCGLDGGEVRTVLGVDRYLPAIRSRRREAERDGVRGVPTLARDGRSLEGLAGEERLAAFLAD